MQHWLRVDGCPWVQAVCLPFLSFVTFLNFAIYFFLHFVYELRALLQWLQMLSVGHHLIVAVFTLFHDTL